MKTSVYILNRYDLGSHYYRNTASKEFPSMLKITDLSTSLPFPRLSSLTTLSYKDLTFYGTFPCTLRVVRSVGVPRRPEKNTVLMVEVSIEYQPDNYQQFS